MPETTEEKNQRPTHSRSHFSTTPSELCQTFLQENKEKRSPEKLADLFEKYFEYTLEKIMTLIKDDNNLKEAESLIVQMGKEFSFIERLSCVESEAKKKIAKQYRPQYHGARACFKIVDGVERAIQSQRSSQAMTRTFNQCFSELYAFDNLAEEDIEFFIEKIDQLRQQIEKKSTEASILPEKAGAILSKISHCLLWLKMLEKKISISILNQEDLASIQTRLIEVIYKYYNRPVLQKAYQEKIEDISKRISNGIEGTLTQWINLIVSRQNIGSDPKRTKIEECLTFFIKKINGRNPSAKRATNSLKITILLKKKPLFKERFHPILQKIISNLIKEFIESELVIIAKQLDTYSTTLSMPLDDKKKEMDCLLKLLNDIRATIKNSRKYNFSRETMLSECERLMKQREVLSAQIKEEKIIEKIHAFIFNQLFKKSSKKRFIGINKGAFISTLFLFLSGRIKVNSKGHLEDSLQGDELKETRKFFEEKIIKAHIGELEAFKKFLENLHAALIASSQPFPNTSLKQYAKMHLHLSHESLPDFSSLLQHAKLSQHANTIIFPRWQNISTQLLTKKDLTGLKNAFETLIKEHCKLHGWKAEITQCSYYPNPNERTLVFEFTMTNLFGSTADHFAKVVYCPESEEAFFACRDLEGTGRGDVFIATSNRAIFKPPLSEDGASQEGPNNRQNYAWFYRSKRAPTEEDASELQALKA